MFCDIRLEKDVGTGIPFIFKNNYAAFFEGPFFVANFNKKIRSDVFVFSNTTLPPSELRHKLLGGREIPIDNADFNQNFTIYANDAMTVMYVLTPALMEKILSLKQLVKSNISLSFKQNKIYIAIARGADSFEPSLDQPILNARIAKDIKADLDAMLQIVKILKLNEKFRRLSQVQGGARRASKIRQGKARRVDETRRGEAKRLDKTKWSRIGCWGETRERRASAIKFHAGLRNFSNGMKFRVGLQILVMG